MNLTSKSVVIKCLAAPPKLLRFISAFHENTREWVRFDGNVSSEFQYNGGVKQGCELAPTLFGIFLSLLLDSAFRDCETGVFLHTRSSGNLFNVRRLRAKTLRQRLLVRELLFADDTALVAHTESDLQALINRCNRFGHVISQPKIEVMQQDSLAERPTDIRLNNELLNNTNTFRYLGCTISSSSRVDAEINARL